MKRIILLVTLAVACVCGVSAKYLEKGMTQYSYVKNSRFGEPVSEFSTRLVWEDDTIVGGETYYKVVYYEDFKRLGDNLEEKSAPKLMALMREDDGKIYCIKDMANGATTGYVIYDFDIQPGEEVSFCDAGWLFRPAEYMNDFFKTAELVAERKVKSAGKELDAVEIQETYWATFQPEKRKNPYTYIWIKGAGFMYGDLLTNEFIYGTADPDVVVDHSIKVLYAADGSVICDYGDIELVEETAGVSQVDVETVGDGVKYNIDGTVHQQGQKGMYILNGQKYMER